MKTVGRLEFMHNGVRFVNCVSSSIKMESKRGQISGISGSSRRRLRRIMMESWSMLPAWKVTLTIPANRYIDNLDFSKRWSMFRKRVSRLQIAVIWRLELHRSLVPHLHLILWCEQSLAALVRSHWLDVWELWGFIAAEEKAVQIEPVVDRLAWLAYCALHNQKKDNDQARNVWPGRHWGVIGREFLEDGRRVYEFNDPGVYERFRKLANRVFRARGRKKELPLRSSWDQLGFVDDVLLMRILKKVES